MASLINEHVDYTLINIVNIYYTLAEPKNIELLPWVNYFTYLIWDTT
jgi:hypothetical protein